MNDENEKRELEQLVQLELRRLPEPQAPETLLHRVMLSVHQRARQPWWRRSWLRWPLWARLVSLAVMVACAVAISAVVTAGLRQVGGLGLSGRADEWMESLRPAYGTVSALGGALVTVVKAMGAMFWLTLAGLLGFVYVMFIGLGSLCVRMAYNRV